MNIIHRDETETGPRLRKTLTDKHGITPTLVREHIGNLMISGAYTTPHVDLYTYVRPSDGKKLYFVEMSSWYPPDTALWHSWLIDGPEPTDVEVLDMIEADHRHLDAARTLL